MSKGPAFAKRLALAKKISPCQLRSAFVKRLAAARRASPCQKGQPAKRVSPCQKGQPLPKRPAFGKKVSPCKRVSLCCRKPLEKGMANKPCSLPIPSPCQRVYGVHGPIATLDPPQQYWQVYHETWVHNVGEASFRVDQASLVQRNNGPNTFYMCLWLKPLNHVFPVVQPHITLGTVEFPSLQSAWIAILHCQSFLWPRVVKGQFSRYGQYNFALKEGNELSALVHILKETLKKDAITTDMMDRWPHITWCPILQFGT